MMVSKIKISQNQLCLLYIFFSEPGLLAFHKRGILVKESIGKARIPIIRTGGADGEVSVMWRTKDKSAISGRDYIGGEGILNFKHTEVKLS